MPSPCVILLESRSEQRCQVVEVGLRHEADAEGRARDGIHRPRAECLILPLDRWVCNGCVHSASAGRLNLVATKRSLDLTIADATNIGCATYCGRRMTTRPLAPHRRPLRYRSDAQSRPQEDGDPAQEKLLSRASQ